MSQQFEFQSRLKVNLKTADGVYDQGMAVTQGIINSSFEGLYNRYTDLQKIEWSNDEAEMKADLLPSRILIPESVGLNLAKIYHQIRFVLFSFTNTPCSFAFPGVGILTIAKYLQFQDGNPEKEVCRPDLQTRWLDGGGRL